MFKLEMFQVEQTFSKTKTILLFFVGGVTTIPHPPKSGVISDVTCVLLSHVAT